MKKEVDYRKIWENAFGAIPKDEQGRSYEIHHIDGDRTNNSLSNLKCVSIDEHFKIHLLQGDSNACHAINIRKNNEATLSGWNHSEEVKGKISKAHRGKKRGPYSEERRKAISEGKKGVIRNRESILKMVETRRKNGSYKVSKETIQKRQETKRKNGTVNPNSVESLKKRRETIKKNPYKHTAESIRKAVETRRRNGSYGNKNKNGKL